MSRYHANELLDKSKQKNDIQHWKYVKKIKVGSGNRYFYSWDEYKAYLADPTAELEKAGNRAKQEIKTAGKKASVQVKKTGKKSYKEIQSRGKKAVEKMSAKQTKGNVTLGVVKAKNKSRPESFKQRLDELAKKASEKWNAGKDKIVKTVKKGRDWIENKLNERKKKKEEQKRKEDARYNQKAEKVAKKYKYLKRVKIDGRYYYFYTQDEIDNFNKVKDYQANEPDFMKKVKESDVPYTEQENSIMVNPNFNLYDYDEKWEYNCAECTAIYELRMRGYDVESNGLSSAVDRRVQDYNLVGRFDLFYEGANVQKPQPTETDEETYQAIKKEIEKNPPGSRGDLSVTWKDGGGHSVVWERDLDGKIHIIDTQFSGHGGQSEYDLKALCRNVDNSSKTCKMYESYGEPATYVTRTDNLKLKPEIQNIYKETKDRKRKKPNTQSTFTVDWDKVADDYVMPEHIMPTRSMTREEIETKYYHLANR